MYLFMYVCMHICMCAKCMHFCMYVGTYVCIMHKKCSTFGISACIYHISYITYAGFYV